MLSMNIMNSFFGCAFAGIWPKNRSSCFARVVQNNEWFACRHTSSCWIGEFCLRTAVGLSSRPLRADTSCTLGTLGLRFIPIGPNMEAWMLPLISVECQICLPITLEYVKLEVNIFVLVNLPCWWCLWPCLLGETGTYKFRADGEIFVSQCKTDSLKGHITNSSSICL